MDLHEYLETLRNIQKNVLEFLENERNTEKQYQNLVSLFKKQNLKENRDYIKELLHILIRISNNHHRTINFFDKIEQILQFFKDEIRFYFTNFDIFNIFKSNKRILLFLFEKDFVHPDKIIAQIITTPIYFQKFYPHYFLPEFSSFFDEKTKQEIEISLNKSIYNEENYELFSKNRKIGENDSLICALIRNDSIDEFISHVSQEKISLSSTIQHSIYETNSYLMKNKTTLIEYSAFFGSTQIFKYLYSKKVKSTSSLLICAIHSQNPELIHLLEENKSKLKNKHYNEYLIESIKCHHIELMKYILSKLLTKSIKSNFTIFTQTLKNHNFTFFPKKIGDDFETFFNLCKYDYLSLVEFLLSTTKISFNQMSI